MKLLKLILLIFCFDFTKSANIFEAKNSQQIVSRFVENLLVDLSSQELPSDVVLLRFGFYNKSKQIVDDIFESIVCSIPRDNVVVTPSSQEVVEGKMLKKPVMIVIVSDVVDTVSGLFVSEK